MHIALVHTFRSNELLCSFAGQAAACPSHTDTTVTSIVAFHVLAHVHAHSMAAAGALTTCRLCC